MYTIDGPQAGPRKLLQSLIHAGAHRSLARGSVRVCHTILREVLGQSRASDRWGHLVIRALGGHLKGTMG